MVKNLWSLFKMAFVVGAVWIIIQAFHHKLFTLIEHSSQHHVLMWLLPFVVFLSISAISTYLAHRKAVPSFVVALFLGQAFKPLLTEITSDPIVLEGIVTLFATTILFQGGLETPLANFKRLFWKIFSLSFVGVWITAITLAWTAYMLGGLTGASLTFTTVVLLGAVLASTDPAAVIPTFKMLKFHDDEPKDIAVSESAVNDVVGALLFFTFLGVLKELGTGFTSIWDGYGTHLFTANSGIFLAKQVFIGGGIGLAGWGLLRLYTLGNKRKELNKGWGGVVLLSVPIISFYVSAALGGSGYLAAFVAGLLFHVSHDQEAQVEHYGESFIDGFSKPIIFACLGAMVNIQDMGQYAIIGILTALVFIFILRPLMVFIMLTGFVWANKMNWKQVLFLSWIRETGAIPAVLLVTVASQAIPGTEPLVPIGMWVILLTLIIQPPLTPIVAKKLGIAEPREHHSVLETV